METGVRESVVKVWFRFLKAAQRLGESIDWSAYKEWGTPDEIEAATFNAWWKSRGRSLFERRRARLKVSTDGSAVTVTFPVTYTVAELRREIGPAVSQHLVKGARTHRGKFTTTGLVRYNELVRYVRLLEIELTGNNKGKPMREKLDLLQQEYGRHTSRLAKQQKTMADKAHGKRIKKLKTPKDFQRYERMGYQWSKKARSIVANVAACTFPGEGYRKQRS